eukprot:scaffold11606_cov56-Attheya_sp.AAC.2
MPSLRHHQGGNERRRRRTQRHTRTSGCKSRHQRHCTQTKHGGQYNYKWTPGSTPGDVHFSCDLDLASRTSRVVVVLGYGRAYLVPVLMGICLTPRCWLPLPDWLEYNSSWYE